MTVSFRRWTYVYGLLLAARERNRAAYVCARCARGQTARALLFTAALGWWSVPGALLLAPRATLRNWTAAFGSPANPARWGAIHGEELRQLLDVPAVGADIEDHVWDSPLRFLTRAQLATVRAARGLYELLDASPDATEAELRAAYRARCKEVHPDLYASGPGAGDRAEDATWRMTELNHAWEILGVPELRAAYDWLAGPHSRARRPDSVAVA